MRRGGKILGSAAILSVAACGEQGKLEIRSVGAPPVAYSQAVPFQIVAARGQLALGNVGLALEGFRKALRDDPKSIDAMTGVAACYDRMARFDLSRRHYEAALAIAPGDAQLLAAFAASLDLQGRGTEAASVRNEIRQRVAVAVENTIPKPASAAVLRPVLTGTVGLMAKPVAEPAKPVAPARRSAVEAVLAAPAIENVPVRPIRIAEVPTAPVASVAPVAPSKPAAAPAIGRSVTVVLPPARRLAEAPPVAPIQSIVSANGAPAAPTVTDIAARKPVQSAAVGPAPIAPQRPAAPPMFANSVTVALPLARQPANAPAAKPAIESAAARSGPRLERTSLREVALVTATGPRWRTLTVGRTQRSATVRFVPLRQASARASTVRLLNAARVNRLAARTRSYLVGRGWSPMAIGDAAKVRARSVIFYPPERRRTAERLSAQFGFVIAQRPGTREITVLLGRDAARVWALRARG